MISAAAYLRVSTRGQSEDDRFGFEVQAHAIQTYAQRNGLSITHTYRDIITGTTATREGLRALITAADQYQAVVISGVDRLGRRVQTSYGILGEMMDAGFAVHAADMGPIDQNDDASATTFAIHTVLADADHRRIVRRLRAGMLAKVRSGQPVVPPTAFGWRDGAHDEAEAQWVRQIYTWARVEGWTAHRITLELNRLGVATRTGARWSESTVKYILKNPLYGGTYAFGQARKGRGDGRDRVTCEVPAIVSPLEWAATQRAIEGRQKGGRPGTRPDADEFPLAKRLTCGVCGGTLSATTNGITAVRKTPYRFYECYRKYRRDGYRGEICTHRRVYSTKTLHPFIRDQLGALAVDDVALIAALHVEPPKPIDNSAAVAALDRRLKNLKLLALDGGLSPAEYRETRGELEAQKVALTAPPPSLPLHPPNLQAARERIAAALESDDLAEVVRALGLRATLHADGRVDLRLSAL